MEQTMPAERTPRMVAGLSAAGLPERGLMSIAPSLAKAIFCPAATLGAPADDGGGFAAADVHGGQSQAVGVGVRVDAEHIAYDEVIGV